MKKPHFVSPYIIADLRRLRSLWLPLFAKFITGSREHSVLNVACGRADETGVLFDVLSRHGGVLDYCGVDMRSRELRLAMDNWKELGQVDFICEDASKALPESRRRAGYDLVVVRHQNLWFDPVSWTKLYEMVLERLADDGYLVITSYFTQEHWEAMQVLSNVGGELLITVENSCSRSLEKDAPGKSVDRHTALFSRAGHSRVGLTSMPLIKTDKQW